MTPQGPPAARAVGLYRCERCENIMEIPQCTQNMDCEVCGLKAVRNYHTYAQVVKAPMIDARTGSSETGLPLRKHQKHEMTCEMHLRWMLRQMWTRASDAVEETKLALRARARRIQDTFEETLEEALDAAFEKVILPMGLSMVNSVTEHFLESPEGQNMILEMEVEVVRQEEESRMLHQEMLALFNRVGLRVLAGEDPHGPEIQAYVAECVSNTPGLGECIAEWANNNPQVVQAAVKQVRDFQLQSDFQ